MKKTSHLFIKSCLALMMIFLLSGCNIPSLLVNSNSEEIIFGVGDFDQGIEKEKKSFLPSEDILMEVYVEEPFGTNVIHFLVLKVEDNTEYIYDQWEISVDPTWDSLIYEFHLVDEYGPYDEGDYIVRLFDHTYDLIIEGNFSIKE